MGSENGVKHADPSALGLFGLAMVTLVASTQKLHITEGTALIIPWAIFLGAFAQIIAGIYDYKKLNIFGATAFLAYGFFWLAVATTWLISGGVFGEYLASTSDMNQLGYAYIGYLILTIFLTIGATETNKVLLTIFILIDFLFLGLSLSTFNIAPHYTKLLAGVSEFLIALVSFYGAGANVLNNHFGYEFLPIGKPLGKFKK
ncbi:MAG: acetate uptake transporter [Lachnospirales bacterium]